MIPRFALTVGLSIATLCVGGLTSRCMAADAAFSDVKATYIPQQARLVVGFKLTAPSRRTIRVRISRDGGKRFLLVPEIFGATATTTVLPGSKRTELSWNGLKSYLGNTTGKLVIELTASEDRYPGSLVYLPKGEFMMGNAGVGDDAAWSFANEKPAHRVMIPDLYIARCEVPRGAFREFIQMGGYQQQANWSEEGWKWLQTTRRTQPDRWSADQNFGRGRFTQTDSHPVIGISFYEAEAYCKWAGVRLLTEAEWERAARWNGSSTMVYPWGNSWKPNVDDPNDPQRNYCNWLYQTASQDFDTVETTRSGWFPKDTSYFGCVDMCGNALEWVSDGYRAYPGGQTAATGDYKVVKGGSIYTQQPANIRCAARGYMKPSGYSWYFYTGFRVAVDSAKVTRVTAPVLVSNTR
ncbi:MAG: formylglycine-generating enzyme family protein [Armatimonadota bacterium]